MNKIADDDNVEAKRRAKLLNDAGIPKEFNELETEWLRGMEQVIEQVKELRVEGLRQANGWYGAKLDMEELQKRLAVLDLEIEGLEADKGYPPYDNQTTLSGSLHGHQTHVHFHRGENFSLSYNLHYRSLLCRWNNKTTGTY